MIKYKIISIVAKIVTKAYIRVKYIGLENIPNNGSFILAGNHIHLLDPLPIMSIINRQVHFLAKKSIFNFPQSLIFNNIGLIKVNRDGNDKEAFNKAVEYLNNNEIIGIYPEGTRERGRGLLNFKTGAVRMAKKTNSVIIPFAIVGEYKAFRKGLVIKFAKPYKVKKDIETSNEELKEIIRRLLNE